MILDKDAADRLGGRLAQDKTATASPLAPGWYREGPNGTLVRVETLADATHRVTTGGRLVRLNSPDPRHARPL